MTPLTQKCRASGQSFSISDGDQVFYNKVGVPFPTLCPEERRRRRYAHRNERHLYHRTCGLSGRALISHYSPESGITVYDHDEWWSDKWDGGSYGRDFDLSRPFFEQFKELSRVIPQLALFVWYSENSSYCNYVGNAKDCYLIFGSVYSEKCYFGSPYYSKNCLDTLVVRECELCYECVDSRKLYECFYCQDCVSSADLIYCYDCQSCQDCIGCAGLRHKQYCIFNKQVTKEEYEKFKKELHLWDGNTRAHLAGELARLKLEIPHRFMHSNQVEDVSGDYVYQARHAHDCFFTDRAQDVAHCMQVVDLKDCMDNNFTEENELCYEYLGAYQNQRLLFSKFCNKVSESFYCDSCYHSKNLFGCVGLRNKQYCILNKQYSKEGYEALVPHIIEHMKETGEWGEFFPVEISPFGYNETVADEYFPLTEEEARTKGYAWKEEDDENSYQGPKASFPENIEEVPDTILDQILTCEVSGKPFVVTNEDKIFYEKMGVPEPTLCPKERMRRRLSFRNERNLYHRKCDLCKKEIISIYAADSPFTVYCPSCWWSDQWDSGAHGQDIDFSRPFFDQFSELMKKVPRISLMNKESENADYCNFALKNKNSYLLTTSAECEDSFYTKRSWRCRNVSDCSNLNECELCYECIDSRNCYNSSWLQNCSESTDCILGYNLKNCQNCFGCFNLVNKKYCIYNEQYSAEDYEKKVAALRRDLVLEVDKFLARKDIPRKFMDAINNENCSGDAVYNSKNALYCFDVHKAEDCKFVFDATFVKDGMDMNNDDHSELEYEVGGSEVNYMHRFNDICWFNKYLTYCNLCFHSEYLFGCVGLQRKKYSILNKNYSKEEFEKLQTKLIEHMLDTKEFGEFFPMKISAFAYNETAAQDYFPLTEEEVKRLGLKWKGDTEETSYQGPKLSPPLDAKTAGPEVTKSIFTCAVSGGFYKITAQELVLYKKMDISLPQKCPEQRYKERMSRKNPRVLWQRPCSSCGTPLQTVYGPDRPERVMCEACYLKEIY